MSGHPNAPGFLDHFYPADEQSPRERREQMERRRLSGQCVKCGHALRVAGYMDGNAQLLCRCGYRTVAKRNSRAYKNAALLEGRA